MALVKFNDPILHKPASSFDFNNPQIDPKELTNTLLLAKNSRKAYGLAAPQIGIPLRVFAFLEEVAFNPELVLEWAPFENETEGCLSYPGIYVQVKRSAESKIRYQNETGEWIERVTSSKLENMVFLHELDHLNGVTFVDKVSDFKLKRAIEQANKHGTNYTFAELRGKV